MKNGTPLVSIIMTTYNREHFIMETIASIQSQTFENWQLLIADDGSDDGTRERVDQLKDPRIQYLYFDRCGIGGKLKNQAIQKSNGEILAFIDSDDLWSPEKLEKQVALMKEFPDAGFSVTNGYNFSDPGRPIDFFYKPKTGFHAGLLYELYFQSELAGFTQALAVRKECLEKIGGFKEEKSFSDIDCIIELAFSFPGIILYEPLVYRRLHSSNYISANWDKSFEEGLAVIQENKKRLPVKLYKNSLFRLYINRGEKWIAMGSKKKALRNFSLAWRSQPFSFIPLKKLAKVFLTQQAFRQTVP